MAMLELPNTKAMRTEMTDRPIIQARFRDETDFEMSQLPILKKTPDIKNR
jgi:hypothetical protein